MVLAKERYGLRGRELKQPEAHFVPFSAQTRMSGCDLDGRVIRKGAVDAIAQARGVARGQRPAGGRAGGRLDREVGRHAARRLRRRRACWASST